MCSGKALKLMLCNSHLLLQTKELHLHCILLLLNKNGNLVTSMLVPQDISRSCLDQRSLSNKQKSLFKTEPIANSVMSHIYSINEADL